MYGVALDCGAEGALAALFALAGAFTGFVATGFLAAGFLAAGFFTLFFATLFFFADFAMPRNLPHAPTPVKPYWIPHSRRDAGPT